jgi:hypothetical protein
MISFSLTRSGALDIGTHKSNLLVFMEGKEK